MLTLRWTTQAAEQLAAIADYVSIASPVYAEQVITQIRQPLEQAQHFLESGRVVPEFAHPEVGEPLLPATPLRDRFESMAHRLFNWAEVRARIL